MSRAYISIHAFDRITPAQAWALLGAASYRMHDGRKPATLELLRAHDRLHAVLIGGTVKERRARNVANSCERARRQVKKAVRK